MFRGITTFKCTHCGKLFKAPDFEYAAANLSCPQKCPKCGSIRTRPAVGGLLGLGVYKGIWEQMEKEIGK